MKEELKNFIFMATIIGLIVLGKNLIEYRDEKIKRLNRVILELKDEQLPICNVEI